MENLKVIRWQQRYQNLHKALTQLKKGVDIDSPNEIEVQGIIQSFEFTFELSWKTLKDYLESQGVEANFPREAIKKAFHYEIIENGECWLEMLTNRNLLAHTYDEELAQKAYLLITEKYFKEITALDDWLKQRVTG